ncbi:MAG: cation diffusion facilitator family transporter, partial [Methanobrevibacter sp.]|nr:cation diffusion facilitator family transporter [Methanobrevibacter sp.]
YIIKIGKEINSPAIVADGKHQKTDIFSSVAVLVGVVVSNMGFPILDPIVGLIIGLLIIKTAYEIAKENIDNIMGKVPSPELIKRVENIANASANTNTAHNIRIDYFGSYATVTLHIELDGNMTLDESHKIAHKVENDILENIPIIKSALVHTCPIGLDYDHQQEIDK